MFAEQWLAAWHYKDRNILREWQKMLRGWWKGAGGLGEPGGEATLFYYYPLTTKQIVEKSVGRGVGNFRSCYYLCKV